MIYIFHRAEGFYPTSMPDDRTAVATALANPGTLKVTDVGNRVIWTNADGAAPTASPKAPHD